jgi:hypothetical protein
MNKQFQKYGDRLKEELHLLLGREEAGTARATRQKTAILGQSKLRIIFSSIPLQS